MGLLFLPAGRDAVKRFVQASHLRHHFLLVSRRVTVAMGDPEQEYPRQDRAYDKDPQGQDVRKGHDTITLNSPPALATGCPDAAYMVC